MNIVGSLAIESLYNSITHSLVIRAIKFYLVKYSEYENSLIEFILLAIEYILSHNYFLFYNAFSVQKMGASMGAMFSPSLADFDIS